MAPPGKQVYFGLFLPALSLALAYGESAMSRPASHPGCGVREAELVVPGG